MTRQKWAMLYRPPSLIWYTPRAVSLQQSSTAWAMSRACTADTGKSRNAPGLTAKPLAAPLKTGSRPLSPEP